MSKLGVHISAGNRRGFGEFLQACVAAASPVPVVFAVDQDVWPDVAKFSPTTIVIFRHQNNDPATGGQDGPGDAYVGDPIQSAQRWMAANMVSWRKNRAHYYAPINEQDAGTLPGYTWLNAFSLECLRIADANGFKLALYGFSGGNPRDGDTDLDRSTLEDKWRELVPSLQFAKQHGHILLLHEYGFGSVAANGGPATSLRASAPDLALRYRRSYRFLHRFDADPPLVISEASAGVGGFGRLGQAAWLEDAQWYDSELMRDRVVIGCCLYQLGGDENFKDVLPALGAYIAAAPTIAPEGDPVIDLDEEIDDVAVDYVVVTHLLPQDATQAEARQVIEIAHAARQSVVYSADDAKRLVRPGLPGSKVVVWAPQRWADDIGAWLDVSTETRQFAADPVPAPAGDGWCPFAIKKPLTNGAYWPGRNGRSVKAVCLHIAEGPLSAVYPWFNRAGAQQSAHFCIGRDGTIEQYVSILDSAWANGKVASPTWVGLINGVNPNTYTISIEHEGYWNEARPQAMDDALIRLLKWLQVQAIWTDGAKPRWTPHVNLIGHGEIDSLSRAHCPGPHVNFSAIAAAANGQPLAQPIVARVGLHDLGGAEWMLKNGRRGIALDHVSITDRPIALDYTRFTRAGIDIVLRVQYGYADGTGTLPPPDRLAKFEQAVIDTLKQATGVLCVQYGNEINNLAEHPGFNPTTGKPGPNYFALSPEYYVASYNRVWRALPAAVLMGPAALDPYYGPGSNNREWWAAILAGIDDADALFLHPKTQTNEPSEIESEARFADDPLRWQYLHYRTIETALEVVPGRLSNLPVILAEVNPQRTPTGLGWLPNNTEWIRRAKAWVTQWNSRADHQAITGVVFYRFDDDDWRLRDKPVLLAEVFKS